MKEIIASKDELIKEKLGKKQAWLRFIDRLKNQREEEIIQE